MARLFLEELRRIGSGCQDGVQRWFELIRAAAILDQAITERG
jgi:hypothetical protein